jgi:hypothetical protein
MEVPPGPITAKTSDLEGATLHVARNLKPRFVAATKHIGLELTTQARQAGRETSFETWSILDGVLVNFEQTGAPSAPIVMMVANDESRFVAPLRDDRQKDEDRNSNNETSSNLRISSFEPSRFVTQRSSLPTGTQGDEKT